MKDTNFLKAVALHLLTNRLVIDDPKQKWQRFAGTDLDDLLIHLGLAAIYGVENTFTDPRGKKHHSFSGFKKLIGTEPRIEDLSRMTLLVSSPSPLEIFEWRKSLLHRIEYRLDCWLLISNS